MTAMALPRPRLSTLFICFLMFVFFVVILFPYQSLKGYIFNRIYKQTGIYLVADDIYLSLFGWPGIGMKNVDATIPFNGRELEFSSQKMIARVGLAGLFPPTASYSLKATGLKKGGDLFAKFSQNKGGTNAQFWTEEVNLEQFFTSSTDAVKGIITSDGSLSYDATDLSKSQGYVNLNLTKLKTPAQNLQGIIIPDVNFGAIKSKINIRNGGVEINSFQMGGTNSDVTGSISGDIRLGTNLMRSVLNITLRLELSNQFRDNPNSATIVSVFNSIDNTKPGTYAMKWATSVEGIVNNLWNALPTKVP
jgi:type II secretion system protein N